MDICLIKKQRQSNVPLQSIFIPDELIVEILSFLSVKTIVRFKCVSKLWNTLISDSTFIHKHLKKSSQKQHLLLIRRDTKGFTFAPVPLYRLHENPSITVHKDNLRCFNDGYYIMGSCNGLICLYTKSLYKVPKGVIKEYSIYSWNPSTRKKLEKLGFFRCRQDINHDYVDIKSFKFAFGYDDSSKTYKVVAIHVKVDENSTKSEVKVFSFGGNGWRNIQCFPVVPLINWSRYDHTCLNNGVHLRGTISWLAIDDYFHSSYQSNNITHVKQFVIISLDLSTETYKMLLLPQGFVEVPKIQPILNFLMESLCFSYVEKDEFVLWQMKEYGIQESWSQLFKISNRIFQGISQWNFYQMACLYKVGDMVILASDCSFHTLIYNLREKKVEKIILNGHTNWYPHANVYVESLLAVC